MLHGKLKPLSLVKLSGIMTKGSSSLSKALQMYFVSFHTMHVIYLAGQYHEFGEPFCS